LAAILVSCVLELSIARLGIGRSKFTQALFGVSVRCVNACNCEHKENCEDDSVADAMPV
jgi:hypothetical protein